MAESNENTELNVERKTSEMDVSNTEQSNPGMERFLQNTRRDLMYELRRLQHGDRPVTGQGHRESINRFFSKRQEVSRSQETDGKENIPSNVDAVEEHRPEAVTVEVQGLFEQRPVSSVLQSAAFRRHLEHIIRGSIATITSRSSTVQPEPSLRSSVQQQSSHTASTVLSPSHASSPVISGNASPILPSSLRSSPASSVSGWINHHSRRGSQGSNAGLPAAVARLADHQGSHNAPQAPTIPSAPIIPGVAQSNATSLPLDQHRVQPLEVQPIQVNLSSEQVSTLIHEQREEFIEDVSELLHRRLVSSTLEGEFRGVLEVHLQERAQVTGSDGPRVQQFIRSIPQTDHHVRNDFSDMNAANGAGGDNWDNISVTSISTHTVPFLQTNAYMSREMQALKAQMREMQSMMRLSFDLQMDIQRAIRQEVSAALANVMGASAITHPPASVPVQDSHCLICLDKYADAVLYQCGHMCVCYSCGKTLMSHGSSCPMCRAPIRDIIRAYKASTE